jgi:hypothetical protein
LGFVKGNTAIFKTPCVMEARPDANLLWMWFGKVDHMASGMFDFYAMMTLRRMPPDWEGALARHKN